MRCRAVTFFIPSLFHVLTPSNRMGDLHLTLAILLDGFLSYWFQVHTLLPNPERSYVNVPRVGTSTFLSQSMGFGSGLWIDQSNGKTPFLFLFPLSPHSCSCGLPSGGMKWTLRLLCPWHLFLPLHLRASGWTHGLFPIWFSRLVVPFCLAMNSEWDLMFAG